MIYAVSKIIKQIIRCEKSYSHLTVAIGAVFIIFLSVNTLASEHIELTAQDVKTNLQAFREDGKFTLTLLRYDECKPCDKAEIQMQQWYDQQDQQKISALIINIDDADQQDAVYARQSKAGVDITSLFARSASGFTEAVEKITGSSFKVVPLFILFGPDGKFMGESMWHQMKWQQLNDAIAKR